MQPSNREVVQDALKHWNEAYGLAMVLTRDRNAAEDLCQEAYLKLTASQRLLDHDQDHAIRPLLFKIVRNLAVSRSRRSTAISLESRVESTGQIADLKTPDPAEEATRREELRAVNRALQQLDPLWHTILYLRDGLGLAYAEIAVIVEKSADVVRVTLHRARQRIRSSLKETQTNRKCS